MRILRRNKWKYRDIVEKRCHFQKHSHFPNCLWEVGHLISVTYCILDLTDSIREIGSSLSTNSTFLILFFFYFYQGHPKVCSAPPCFKINSQLLLCFSRPLPLGPARVNH